MGRLFISRLKTEVKTLVSRATLLEGTHAENVKKLDKVEIDLSNSRLLIQQHEAKMNSLSENIRDMDHKKRQLEEEVDRLNEQYASLKAQGYYQCFIALF